MNPLQPHSFPRTVRDLLFGACFALALLWVTPLSAQVRHIKLDKSPSYLFADSANGFVHVLTAGYDANFNGGLDDGEAAPRWFVIDAVTEKVVDSITFTGLFNSFPIRPGFDLVHRRLYLPIQGRVQVYDLDTRDIVDDGLLVGNYASSSYDRIAGLLAMATRADDFVSPGLLTLFDPEQREAVATMTTGINPGMTAATLLDNKTYTPYYFTVNEGAFGQGNGSLTMTALNPDIYSSVNGGNIGSGGAHAFRAADGRVLLAFQESGTVRIIDSENHKELASSPVAVGGSGAQGPFVTALQGENVLVVGTRSGVLRRFNVSDGAFMDTMTTPGPVAALLVRDSILFAAVAGPGDAPNDSLVVVYNLNTALPIDTIVTGVGPAAMFLDTRGDLHVVGYGTGASSWWTIYDGLSRAVKMQHELSGRIDPSTFPANVAYDGDSDQVFIVLDHKLFKFDALAVGNVGVEMHQHTDLVGVTDAGRYLLAHEVDDVGVKKTWIRVVRKSDGGLQARFRAGEGRVSVATVQAPVDSALGVYALNEGSGSSSLTFLVYAANAFGNLGDGANYIQAFPQGALVTMNGVHELIAIRFDDFTINTRVSTGTSGFDGPRESFFLNDDQVLVTTYAGDVRLLEPNGSSRTFMTGGKAEGLTVIKDKIFVANSFITGAYTPDSTVAVIDLRTLAAPDASNGSSATRLAQNIPNPVRDRTSIGFTLASASHVTLSLYSIDGGLVRRLLDGEMEAGTHELELRADGLAAGTYLYTLYDGIGTHVGIMQVTR